MTLAQIMHLALRQLDEDPADVSEYDDTFKSYVNEGYRILMYEYYKPREDVDFVTDETGRFSIDRKKIIRIVELKDDQGRDVKFDLAANGTSICTELLQKELHAVAEVYAELLKNSLDEPKFPEFAHSCLADYICYRHLSAGNIAKQQKAQFYVQRFRDTARSIRPEWMGSTTQFKGLYAATSI